MAILYKDGKYKVQWNEASFNEVDAAMICLNEEDNIIGCLMDIYDIVDDIIIIDGGSTDRTVDLIRSFKRTDDKYDRIKLYRNDFFKHSNGILGDQKNLAISKTDSLWVLWMDPDERLSDDFKRDFRKIIREHQDMDVIDFYRYNYIDGEPEENFEEDLQCRLFKSFCRYVSTSHHSLVGFNKDERYILLDKKYHMIHNKSSKRAEKNWAFYDEVDKRYPHKNWYISPNIRY